MRVFDIVLIVASVLIILLIGLMPLLTSDDQGGTRREECELFYGSSGPAAVQHCLAEMETQRGDAETP